MDPPWITKVLAACVRAASPIRLAAARNQTTIRPRRAILTAISAMDYGLFAVCSASNVKVVVVAAPW